MWVFCFDLSSNFNHKGIQQSPAHTNSLPSYVSSIQLNMRSPATSPAPVLTAEPNWTPLSASLCCTAEMQLLCNPVPLQAVHRGVKEFIQVFLFYHHLRKQWQHWTRLASSVHSSCFHAHCRWIKLGEHLKHLSNMHCYQHKAFSYSQRQEYANPGKKTARTQCVLNILTGI